jgi:hypothetical protein
MENKNTIVTAINTLVKHDPNFAQNISKLAELCVKNKFVYEQAVKKLKSL